MKKYNITPNVDIENLAELVANCDGTEPILFNNQYLVAFDGKHWTGKPYEIPDDDDDNNVYSENKIDILKYALADIMLGDVYDKDECDSLLSANKPRYNAVKEVADRYAVFCMCAPQVDFLEEIIDTVINAKI
ncbi:hypothetical protein J6A31_05915 [bacterium]|nr:hypothetical protein [bacterium]